MINPTPYAGMSGGNDQIWHQRMDITVMIIVIDYYIIMIIEQIII